MIPSEAYSFDLERGPEQPESKKSSFYEPLNISVEINIQNHCFLASDGSCFEIGKSSSQHQLTIVMCFYEKNGNRDDVKGQVATKYLLRPEEASRSE